MTNRTCSFPECNRAGSNTGLCYPHNRQKAAGKDLKPLQKRATNSTIEEAFFAKVRKGEGCWEWTGPLINTGYGAFWFKTKRTVAHRVSWAIKNGPIPDGHQVDHLCWNKACVNPDHLRLATHKQNQENLQGAQRNSKTGVRGVSWNKTHKVYIAALYHNGVAVLHKRFKTIEEAEAAVVEARNHYFTHNHADRIKA